MVKLSCGGKYGLKWYFWADWGTQLGGDSRQEEKSGGR